MHKIILIGAGGHAKSCIDVIKSTNNYEILGILDKKKKGKFSKIKILGNENFLNNLKKKRNINIAITIGQIKSPNLRKKLFKRIKSLKLNLPKIISKYSIVSKDTFIEEGTMVFHNVIINSGTRVGKNTIINTSALLEHDVIVGNNCHISTGSILNGNVKVGNGTFIGSGSIVREGVKIGSNCVIGMGSVIKKNVRSFSVVKK